MLLDRILLAFSRPVGSEDYADGVDEWEERPLDWLLTAFPDLGQVVKGKLVVDFGCGSGHQASAIAREFDCRVYGLDTNERTLSRAKDQYGSTGVRFYTEPPEHIVGNCDVVISQNSMEHFPDPEGILEEMKRLLKPGGVLLITFGCPWFSPYGSHMHFFCKLPWVNLIFPERTVMRVRSRYRNDGAMRYEDVESGLNKMSVAKFERIIANAGMRVLFRRYTGVKGYDFLTRLPVLRELFVNRIDCALVKVS